MQIPDWLTDPMNFQVRTYDPPLEWSVRMDNRCSAGRPTTAAGDALREVLGSETDLTSVEVLNNSDEVPDATATFRVVAPNWLEVNRRFTDLAERAQERLLELLDKASGWRMTSGGVEVYPADSAAAGPDAYEEAAS